MSDERARAALIGRTRECSALEELLLGSTDVTSVAFLHGEAGIGKTSMLEWATDAARRTGARTLTARGVPMESDLVFAGLQQLLRPLLARGADAPLEGRTAVREALSAPEAAGSAIFRTKLAVLELLAEAAQRQRLAVAVDDLQWWDRPSRDVLTFVARRVAEDPIVVLLAARDPVPAELGQLALADHWLGLRLGRLTNDDAAQLLDRTAPGLALDVRRRVLAEAAGNPLALKELPQTVAATPLNQGLLVPVNERLEAAFAARLAALPETTRTLVVLAAVHDSDDAGELIAAAELGGRPVTLQDLEPAAEVGLLEVRSGEVRFSHPLARSAVYQHAGPAARQSAHRVLARTARSPDRRALHAAEAADRPDEAVAARLEKVAERASRSGAKDIATRALERAATLSESPGGRASRMLRAVEASADTGDHDHTLELLNGVDAGALDLTERPQLDWLRENLTRGPWTGGDRVIDFADIAARMGAAGHRTRAMQLLLGIALRCWWSNIDPAIGTHVADVADALRAGPDDPAHLAVIAMVAPVQRGPEASRTFERLAVPDHHLDASMLVFLGLAGTAVGEHPRAVGMFTAAIAEARRQGQTGVLAQAWVALAWSETHLGRLGRAELAGQEGVRLSRETAQPLWLATGELALAAARGLRGHPGDTDTLALQAEQVYLAASAHPMLAQVRAARGLAALGAGRHEDALTQLAGVFDPAGLAHHVHFQTFLVSELAEAAARSGRRDTARDAIAHLEARLEATGSPILHAGLMVARPLLADEADVENLYLEALADGLGAWPLHRARLQLGYGAWLRRRRRIAEARQPLRTARDTLAALDAGPWAERAAQELRAAGEADQVRLAHAWERLTPQELQIAQLAVAGLTNRQIGERLFLSHRTVGAHLYHVFPKLGISTRTQLRAALEGAELTDVAD